MPSSARLFQVTPASPVAAVRKVNAPAAPNAKRNLRGPPPAAHPHTKIPETVQVSWPAACLLRTVTTFQTAEGMPHAADSRKTGCNTIRAAMCQRLVR